jgi:hypothetical protein
LDFGVKITTGGGAGPGHDDDDDAWHMIYDRW